MNVADDQLLRKRFRNRTVRCWSVFLILLAVALWSLAPWYQLRLGWSDSAAWVPLFMLPTSLLGCILGIVIIIFPSWTGLVFQLVAMLPNVLLFFHLWGL
jgi:hypothetical protein